METTISKATMLDMYRIMIRIREFEAEAIELAKANITRAAVHTYNGEEAIATGVCVHLSNDDYITSTHRGHGHCIAKGADLRRMFAELMGRETGYCKGKGGSMHIADMKTGNLGANGIVGGGIPMAMGAGLGLQVAKEKHVAVSFFGDGASNEGSFHEALNMASIWKLPVIFICENNKYGISTSTAKSMNIEHIADRAVAYGIKGLTVNGNNIVDVYHTFAEAKEYALAGNGPVLLEMDTFRMAGHYFGDNENYRSREEVEKWKAKDPILYCETLLREDYAIEQEQLDAIKKEEAQRVLAASEQAKQDPEPMIEDMLNDLYDPTFEEIEWQAFSKA
ncbi:thiamine pyrophosphate-dependent dehydrogenase E1 component subunit alpha [Enterococcus hulanensis]|uniref:thiamine pyrophosphate-dependent dehydrogenase E1 component subunit alpha n=1 Tax=Enterococcus TaxID=1350 RepID=UPI001A8C019C|nr:MULTISPECIES: thiamine pyrophosphate-dependent dehydrogenase E1 component subunit alpha [Enterococcus]MBO0459257.1 thiamine pyrophosphate-dependent dehydrogenase E1 component subunit alpha [Enterococcus hulanensis]MDT2662398.1 thiamine pyrophosphate-dependent dehydrogenase E1 component subunit alpha [Enterococcus hulanensis]